MWPLTFPVAFALLSCCFVPPSSSFNLTILHTNDVHARIREINAFGGRCRTGQSCYGGFARIAAKVAEIRAREENVLFLDGGDQFQGTLWYYFFRSSVVTQFVNQANYDVMAIGNHEFDNGVAELATYLQRNNASVVSANIDATREPQLQSLFSRSVTMNVSGELIGIVGYTTTDTPAISKPGDKLTFTPVVSSVQTEVDKLTQQGVNKIIALGHAGIDVDTEVASGVRGVDVVVGGHTNTFLYTGDAPSVEDPYGAYPLVIRPDHDPSRPVLVVQDFAFGKYLGYLRVTFDDDGALVHWDGNPILLDETVPKDPGISAQVETLQARLTNETTRSIGNTHVLLDGDCRSGECNLGNLMADAMLHQNIKHPDGTGWNDVAIAVMNSGGIRDTITKGSISIGDVIGTSPFMNTIDIVELRGEDVLRMLEHAGSLFPASNPRLLQVSGLRITYDIAKPVQQRVVRVDARCSTDCVVPEFRPLNVSAVYKIIMPTFLANGGDHFDMIKENKTAHHIPGDLDSDILIEYITAMSPLSIGVEGRVQVINSSQTSPDQCRNVPTSPTTTLSSIDGDGSGHNQSKDGNDQTALVVALSVGIPLLACVAVMCIVLRKRRERNSSDTPTSYDMGHANPAVVMETGEAS